MAIITFLVEDNARIRDHLIPTLEDLADAQVLGFAETESDALDWLEAHSGEWSLAVVDLFLKEGSGLGILKGCKERKSHQRVVLLTNYATPEIRRQALALGADAIFDKSTELVELFDYASMLSSADDVKPLARQNTVLGKLPGT